MGAAARWVQEGLTAARGGKPCLFLNTPTPVPSAMADYSPPPLFLLAQAIGRPRYEPL